MYRAVEENLGREVAIKVFNFQANSPVQERFLREAQLTSQLQHPGGGA